jgi:hypothetical protein
MTQFPDDEFNEHAMTGNAPPHPMRLQQPNTAPARPPAPFVAPPAYQQRRPQADLTGAAVVPPQGTPINFPPIPEAFQSPFPAMGENEFMSPAEAMNSGEFTPAAPFPPNYHAPQQAAAPQPSIPTDILQRYYRVPGLHVMIPTRGVFFEPQDYSPALNNELPVFPMRAADELLMKNPDALMSGFAIEELLRSCVPGIPNPRKISSPDLDVLLLAIRAASYGENMDIDAECPECGHEHSFECHLPTVMSTMQVVPAQNPVHLAPDLVVYVRPYTLETSTRMALITYEEARKIQVVEAEGGDITTVRNSAFRRLTSLNTGAMVDSILSVIVPEGEVTDKLQIANFIKNIDRSMTAKIENRLRELNNMGIDKRIDMKCEGCGHEWPTEIEFNPSSFFAQGS